MLGTRGRNKNALALVIYKSLPKLKAFMWYLQYLHPQYMAPMIFSKNRDGELVTSRITPSPLTNHHYPAKFGRDFLGYPQFSRYQSHIHSSVNLNPYLFLLLNPW